jgi:signal peptidase I
VIAVPGDTVQIIKGVVYVNGEVFTEEVTTSSIEEPGIAVEPIVLGEDEYFVLGDNRNNSEDSRFANIGNVRKEHIIGKVWFKIVSWKEFGFL